MLYQARHDSTSEISCIFHHSQNGSFRSHQILKVNCQRTCLMSFSSENREKTLRFVLTFHGQATDKLPTGYRHITNSRPTGSLYFRQNLSANRRPTVSRQVFWGALLHNYQNCMADSKENYWPKMAYITNI